MQGRFGATIVDEDEYILKLSRYVHLNPVYIKKVQALPIRERIELLRHYPWSSYRQRSCLHRALTAYALSEWP